MSTAEIIDKATGKILEEFLPPVAIPTLAQVLDTSNDASGNSITNLNNLEVTSLSNASNLITVSNAILQLGEITLNPLDSIAQCATLNVLNPSGSIIAGIDESGQVICEVVTLNEDGIQIYSTQAGTLILENQKTSLVKVSDGTITGQIYDTAINPPVIISSGTMNLGQYNPSPATQSPKTIHTFTIPDSQTVNYLDLTMYFQSGQFVSEQGENYTFNFYLSDTNDGAIDTTKCIPLTFTSVNPQVDLSTFNNGNNRMRIVVENAVSEIYLVFSVSTGNPALLENAVINYQLTTGNFAYKDI